MSLTFCQSIHLMTDLILGITISIVAGVISSYLFLMYFLKRKRVKIEISPHVSKVIFEGEVNYFFNVEMCKEISQAKSSLP